METIKNNPFEKIPGKALVVFSGGQDSTTCLYWAMGIFDSVEAVTYDYGQRHVKEVEVAAAIAGELKIPHHILDLSLIGQLAPSALTREDISVDSAEKAEELLSEGTLPSTFVPGRNMVFLAFSGILARQIGADHIITGVSQADYSGYPDCREAFIKSMNETINLAMEENIQIHTPLMFLDKKDVWALSDRLGVLDVIRTGTLTCYNGIMGDGCGECPSCHLRSRGLEAYMESIGKNG